MLEKEEWGLLGASGPRRSVSEISVFIQDSLHNYRSEMTRNQVGLSESNKNFNEIAFTLRTILVKGVNAFRANYLFGQ